MSSTVKLKKSYSFFVERENKKISFVFDELLNYTGWSGSTLNTYLSKKWGRFLTISGQDYFVSGVAKYSEEEYLRLMSQAQKNYEDPTKPRFDIETEKLILKAKESALLALDIYNRPATTFKSEGYIVMIIIAWTSLLHAIFQKNKIDYFYKENDGSFKIIDDDYKAWELSECIKQHFGETDDAVVSNLKFLIGLRNKIEHRYVPTIDGMVVGECQAALLNFDDLITQEFGEYFALKDYISVPLQTSNIRTEKQIELQKRYQGKHYDIIKEYINKFREQVRNDIYQNPKYSFRVFLIPKIGNHITSSDIAIEFIKYDPDNPVDMETYEKQVALIKEKQVPVINPGKLKAGKVALEVEKRLNKKFSVSYHHPLAYKYYKIRPQENKAEGCNITYCQFDDAHKDFVYSQAWIEFLVKKLANDEEYNRVFLKIN